MLEQFDGEARRILYCAQHYANQNGAREFLVCYLLIALLDGRDAEVRPLDLLPDASEPKNKRQAHALPWTDEARAFLTSAIYEAKRRGSQEVSHDDFVSAARSLILRNEGIGVVSSDIRVHPSLGATVPLLGSQQRAFRIRGPHVLCGITLMILRWLAHVPQRQQWIAERARSMLQEEIDIQSDAHHYH